MDYVSGKDLEVIIYFDYYMWWWRAKLTNTDALFTCSLIGMIQKHHNSLV